MAEIPSLRRGKARSGILLVAAASSSIAVFTLAALLLLRGVGLSLSILALIVIVAAVGPVGRRSQIPFGWWVLAMIAAAAIGLFICALWFAANFELGE